MMCTLKFASLYYTVIILHNEKTEPKPCFLSFFIFVIRRRDGKVICIFIYIINLP